MINLSVEIPSSSSAAIPTVSVDARIDAEGPGNTRIDANAFIDAGIDTNASIDIGIDSNLTVDSNLTIDADTTGDTLLPLPEREFPNREELVEFVC